MNDLRNRNYEFLKVEENTHYKTWRKKMLTLLKKCEQLKQN